MPLAAIVITTDIPSCYDTIKRSSVMRDVPLPRHVMKAVLIDTKERAVHLVQGPKGKLKPLADLPKDFNVLLEDAGPLGRGILTGAALASVASECVIKQVLLAAEAAAPGVHAASWGDNLIFILEDASVATPVYAAVEAAVCKNFGMDVLDGLALRKIETSLPDPFYYCGQWYWLDDGKLRHRTDASRIERAKIKLALAVAEMKSEDDYKRIKRSMIGYVQANRHMPSIVNDYLEYAFAIGEAKSSKLALEMLTEKNLQ